jgi:uncharacterized protein YhaN
MRFLEIHLKAFGHFTEFVLALNPPAESCGGLHLIVGANEAGKSTTLQAIARFLFGFKRGDEPYDFLHRKNRLRIGAQIDRGDRTRQTLWRSKTGNALTLAESNAAVPESAIESIFESLGEEQYLKLFGLNQRKLREGGEELAKGKGDFSRILFGESLGDLEMFTALRKSIRDEADALFKPGGRGNAKSPLNQIKAERDRLKAELDQATTTSLKWNELESQRDKLKDTVRKLDETIDRLTFQTQRLERLAKSRGSIENLDSLNRRMDDHRNLPTVPETLFAEFIGLESDSKNQKENLEKFQESIKELQDSIDSTRLDSKLLEQGERISTMARRAAAVSQTRSKLEERKSKLDETLRSIEEAVRDLGFESADIPRLPRTDKIRTDAMTSLKISILSLAERQNNLRHSLLRLRSDLSKSTASLAEIPPMPDQRPLDAALNRMESLQSRLVVLSTSISQKEASERLRDKLLKSLPLWSGTWTDFETVKLPDFEIVRIDEDFLAEANSKRKAAQEELDKLTQSLEMSRGMLNNQLEQLQIPSPEILAETRRSRDRNWVEIRSRWIFSEPSETTISRNMDNATLADVFEAETQRADQLADLMREHLKTVELMRQCKDLEVQKPILEANLRACEDAWSKAQADWASHFRFLPELPTRPEEMRSWPATVVEIQRLIGEIHAFDIQIRQIQGEWEDCRDKFVLPLLPESTPDEPFEFYRKALQELRDKYVAIAAKRQNLEISAKDYRDQITQTEADFENVREEFESSLVDWRNRLEEFGYPIEITPESFADYDSKLKICRKDIARYEDDRIQHQQDLTDIADFESAITALAQSIDFAEISTDPVRIAESMNANLIEERKNLQRLKDLQSRLETETRKKDEAERALGKALEGIAKICETIGVKEAIEAPDRFAEIAERDKIQRGIESAIDLLNIHRDDEPLESWIQAARELDDEACRISQDELRNSIAETKKEREESAKILFGIETEISRIEGAVDSADVLVVEQARKAFFERTVELTRRYLKCMLTNRVLEQAAEAYRRKMGQQVIDFTSENLRTLSLGSLSGVITVHDDDSGRRLVAVRSDDDSTLELEHLSEGTADQLFLALKLAMIRNRLEERKARGQGPVPVIFDDILVQFDDDRAAAAFRLFADLARTTQVIFLTHHRHLVDVARGALGDGTFGVHYLAQDVPATDAAGSPPAAAFRLDASAR